MQKTLQIFFLGVLGLLTMSPETVAQKLWYAVGQAGFSAGAVQYPSIAVDNNGVKYVAYTDAANGNKATVMKYNGTNWVAVGSAGFSAGRAYSTSIAIDNSGTPYVVYQDSANGFKASVMKFNGAVWVAVGGVGFSAGAVHETEITIDNGGIPYVAYRDSANNAKATVMKFNGSNWVTVGSAGFSTGAVNQLSFCIDNIGTPYVAYTDLSANNAGYVMKYNGTNWVVVHYYANAPFSSSDIGLANIRIGRNDTPFIAYYYPAISVSYVKKFDGISWVLVGTTAFAPNTASLAVDSNGIPYVAVKDTTKSGKISVMKYDGANWVISGSAGFSSDTFNYASMVFDKNNILNIVYQDGGNSNRATVMNYGCPPNAKVPICAVVSDTVINGNIVIAWDAAAVSNFADSFMIYREDNGNYSKIGTVPASFNSFTDVTALPSLQSYRYKLTYIDKCGSAMPLDSSINHRSLLLTFNYLIDGKASITWNSYEGIPNPVYTVKRSNNGGAFTAISNFTITGSDTTYIDVNPPAGSNRYMVEISSANPCSIGIITSNIATSWHTEIREVAGNRNIALMPNPARSELKISVNENLLKIEIFNLQGQRLFSERGTGGRVSIIDVSGLPNGMYLINVNDIHKASFVKQ